MYYSNLRMSKMLKNYSIPNKCKNCTQSLFTREENELINKKKCYVYVIYVRYCFLDDDISMMIFLFF